MSEQKVYYSIYTTQEKIWIRADVCETLDGCLVFSDFDDDGKTKITIATTAGSSIIPKPSTIQILISAKIKSNPNPA